MKQIVVVISRTKGETTDERNAILREYGEDLSSKTASNAEENFLSGKQTKFMNGPSAMANDESAASE
ncbi:unnamed protein product [Anisakis simplex]|uniref:30S ribosomal protein S6 n=1 Tax=Anisakis simplex TaxID=6269 RepID=A0A0M3JN60_ANISI|nr:unnamed protein product [Anisakis simplex]